MQSFRHALLAASLVIAGCAAEPPAAPGAGVSVLNTADAQRGRLLYGAQCIACHTTQAHWRDKRLVQSWDGLVSQVVRWQGNGNLGWTQDEIQDVAAYLNGTFYHLECSIAGCTGRPSQAGL